MKIILDNCIECLNDTSVQKPSKEDLWYVIKTVKLAKDFETKPVIKLCELIVENSRKIYSYIKMKEDNSRVQTILSLTGAISSRRFTSSYDSEAQSS